MENLKKMIIELVRNDFHFRTDLQEALGIEDLEERIENLESK